MAWHRLQKLVFDFGQVVRLSGWVLQPAEPPRTTSRNGEDQGEIDLHGRARPRSCGTTVGRQDRALVPRTPRETLLDRMRD